MPYHLTMQLPDELAARRALSTYIVRKGHGAITELRRKTGLSRQTITRFRDGGSPDDATLLRLAEVLEEEGYLGRGGASRATAPGHSVEAEVERMQLQNLVKRDAASLLALRLQALAEFLVSDDATPDQKTEEFVFFIESCHRSIDAWRAALQKAGNESG